jgi:hypothetical protein
MSPLERLPVFVRKEILRYLLLADRVRLPPNHLMIEHYSFEVVVLRLSRTISADATAVLYEENKFIKVDDYFCQAEDAMLNHETPFFALKKKPFRQHVATITWKPSSVREHLQTSKGKMTVLILLQDIPKFTRLLRVLDLANFMGYEFNFALHQPPTASSTLALKDQERLLLPFERVRGGGLQQKVTFTGGFDTTLTNRVKEAMTQNVSWLRGAAAEIHDIALSIKRMGDKAWNLGIADMILAKYDDTHSFIEAALKQNNFIDKQLDGEFVFRIAALDCMTWMDQAFFFLTDMAVKELGEKKYEMFPRWFLHVELAEKYNQKSGKELVPKAAISRFYQVLGVAELGLGHPNKAGKAFAHAYKFVSSPKTKLGHETAKAWKDLSSADRTSRLNLLLAALHIMPFPISEFGAWSGPEVASEHWVMRELGFQGPIPYSDKITGEWAIVMTNKPHPNLSRPGPRTARIGEVKPEVLKKHVQQYRKQINHPLFKARGCRPMVWVALGVDLLGEESILDDPQAASALDNLRPGACTPQ